MGTRSPLYPPRDLLGLLAKVVPEFAGLVLQPKEPERLTGG